MATRITIEVEENYISKIQLAGLIQYMTEAAFYVTEVKTKHVPDVHDSIRWTPQKGWK